LLDLIVRRHCKPLDRLGLNAVDLGLDLTQFCIALSESIALLSSRATHLRPAWRRLWPL